MKEKKSTKVGLFYWWAFPSFIKGDYFCLKKINLSRRTTKHTIKLMRPAKTPISQRMRAV